MQVKLKSGRLPDGFVGTPHPGLTRLGDIIVVSNSLMERVQQCRGCSKCAVKGGSLDYLGFSFKCRVQLGCRVQLWCRVRGLT